MTDSPETRPLGRPGPSERMIGYDEMLQFQCPLRGESLTDTDVSAVYPYVMAINGEVMRTSTSRLTQQLRLHHELKGTVYYPPQTFPSPRLFMLSSTLSTIRFCNSIRHRPTTE